MKDNIIRSAVAAAMLGLMGAAWGHGAEEHKSSATEHGSSTKQAHDASEETAFGKPGDPKKAARTIDVDASDSLRFTPSQLAIRRGETVRFVVRNSGKLAHEMVLGTMDELKEHAALMRKFPDMEHDEPSMTQMKPGATGSFAWQFTKAGEFYYGCLVPGHFEGGMVGKIVVK